MRWKANRTDESPKQWLAGKNSWLNDNKLSRKKSSVWKIMLALIGYEDPSTTGSYDRSFVDRLTVFFFFFCSVGHFNSKLRKFAAKTVELQHGVSE